MNDKFEAFEREIKAQVEAQKRMQDNVRAVLGVLKHAEENRLANLPPIVIQEQI